MEEVGESREEEGGTRGPTNASDTLRERRLSLLSEQTEEKVGMMRPGGYPREFLGGDTYLLGGSQG